MFKIFTLGREVWKNGAMHRFGLSHGSKLNGTVSVNIFLASVNLAQSIRLQDRCKMLQAEESQNIGCSGSYHRQKLLQKRYYYTF